MTSQAQPTPDPFTEWLSETEGYSLRAERIEGDVTWLRAAFEAGQRAAIKALMEPSQEQRIAGAHALDIRPSDAAKVWQAMIRASLANENAPRPMTGFFDTLTPEGQAAVLAYDGDDSVAPIRAELESKNG